MEGVTITLYGIPVLKLPMAETVRLLTEAAASGRPHQVITANPIMVMTALEQPSYMDIMRSADFVVPDGAGLVWAAGYVGKPVAERVTGFDLMHELMKEGDKRGWRVYLLGASRETIETAAEKLQARYPNCEIRWRDGYFQEDQDGEVIRGIRDFHPQLLFVGRSAANQEPWIAQYKEELAVPLVMGVGGSFDVIAGNLKRAPVWLQNLKLEWLYRLMQEPWRYKRMLVLPKFAWKVIREKEKIRIS